MKATRKLIPAIAMLLVSLAVMSTASFAWFTMSRQVTAQGMDVSVIAPNNLMIKATGAEDSTYAELTQLSATGVVLVPASTTSGKKDEIFSVVSGQAVKPSDGSLITSGESRTKLEKGTLATTTVEGAYYDFKYTIKSDIAEDGASIKVVVTSVVITNNTSGDGKSVKPVRVAVLSADEANVFLFNPESGEHHTTGQAVTSVDGSGYPTLAAVTYTTPAAKNTDSNIVVTLTKAAPTADIVIRVWYEGEDTDCVVSTGAKANFDVKVVLSDVASLPD